MSGEPPYRVEVEYVSATRFTSPLAKLSWNDVRGDSLEGVSHDEDAPEGSTGSSKCITTIAFELAVCRMSASRETLSSTVRKLQRTGPQRGSGRSKELVRRRAKSMLRLSAEARHPTLPVSVNAVSEDTREAPAVTLSPSDSRSAGVHRKKSTELEVTSTRRPVRRGKARWFNYPDIGESEVSFIEAWRWIK